MLHPYPNVDDAVQLAEAAAEVPLSWKKMLMKINFLTLYSCNFAIYFVTSKRGCQRCRKNQKGSKQIYNAEILDENKANNLVLDVTSADIEDHTAVGDDSYNDDNKDQRTLDCFRKVENFTGGFFNFSKTNI